MNKCILLTFVVVLFAQAQTPNALQREQIKRGYGLFIHFGINTFNQTEWSDGALAVESYNPTKLDCNQWVKTAKETGFRYVILVTKHHDGFCLWDRHELSYKNTSKYIKYMKRQLKELLTNYGGVCNLIADKITPIPIGN